MIRPLSRRARRAIMAVLLGSGVLGVLVNGLWASRQLVTAYWTARLLIGLPAMLAGWPLLLAPGLVARLWGLRPATQEDHPDQPPKWPFGQLLRLALFGAILATVGTTFVAITVLSLLSGCIDPVLSWDACP